MNEPIRTKSNYHKQIEIFAKLIETGVKIDNPIQDGANRFIYSFDVGDADMSLVKPLLDEFTTLKSKMDDK